MKIVFLKCKIFYFLFLIFAIFIFPKFSFSASLYFSPSSGSYNVGQNFTVNVLVESNEQAMNAVSGLINFPADKLEIVSLSKNGSILNLWVQEPSFSNALGTINFEGIVLNPGFQGGTGKILSINFKAKSVGQAGLIFKSASVLANDGQGTNILQNLKSANFYFTQQEQPKQDNVIQIQNLNLPSKPEIFSLTHPDQDRWYSLNNVTFSWSISKDILALKMGLDKNPDGKPSILVDFPVNFKEYKNLEDGIWYFHLQLKNQKGWSEIAHYRVQIDLTPPKAFSIEFIDGKVTRNQRPVILFNTEDETSGIDFYKIKIGRGDYFDLSTEVAHNPYTLPLQAPGKHTILVQAFDKAGNYTYAKDEFEILPPPSLFEVFTKKISITLSYLIPLLALLIILIILILYGLRYIIILRKKLKKEKEMSFKEIHMIFEFLRKETENKIKELEKIKNIRNLTKEEEEIISYLKENLNRSEKIIKKDFDEIFKEIDKKIF